MCGIVGYIGDRNAKDVLINMLRRLEYRGYDSAGISLNSSSEIITIKSKGAVDNLVVKLKDVSNYLTCGIGHTRWATHGKPNVINAHPHTSSDNNWSVVHNGIIENYISLKEDLLKNGVIIKSETDTEIISQLFQKNSYMSDTKNILETTKQLQGSYALAILHSYAYEHIYLCKKDSPLYVGVNDNETFIASDLIAFEGLTKKYFCLNDNEFAKIKKRKISFFNKNGKLIIKELNVLKSNEIKTIDLQNSHHMIKEIYETPQIIKNSFDLFYSNDEILKKLKKLQLKSFTCVYFIGCGTAYHSALACAKFFYKSLNTQTFIASEFRYMNPRLNKKILCIFISQSGETADTLASLKLAKDKGCKCISITNHLNSSIASHSDINIPINAGPEIAVASTKAYSAQIITLYMLYNYLVKHLVNKNMIYKRIEKISKQIENILSDAKLKKLKKICEKINKRNRVFYIGRGNDYTTAKEGSLKLKEISYINSSALPAGELKHGTLALVDNKTYVIALITNKKLYSKTVNSIKEIQARGGKIILFSNQFESKKNLQRGDIFFKLFKSYKDLNLITSIIPLQLLAYFSSVMKGINPDKPKNLAKSVTVE